MKLDELGQLPPGSHGPYFHAHCTPPAQIQMVVVAPVQTQSPGLPTSAPGLGAPYHQPYEPPGRYVAALQAYHSVLTDGAPVPSGPTQTTSNGPGPPSSSLPASPTSPAAQANTPPPNAWIDAPVPSLGRVPAAADAVTPPLGRTRSGPANGDKGLCGGCREPVMPHQQRKKLDGVCVLGLTGRQPCSTLCVGPCRLSSATLRSTYFVNVV
jgi:hypothetical protein